MGLQEHREKEKDNRRMLIPESTHSLFFAKGFKDVTVDEIAKLSELGNGSIHLFFSGKEDIYAQILLHDIEIFYHQAIAIALFNKKKTAIDIISYILQCIISSKELPAMIDIKHNQFVLWGMFNGIIALRIFTCFENNRRDKIHSSIKTAFKTYVKGLNQDSGNFFDYRTEDVYE